MSNDANIFGCELQLEYCYLHLCAVTITGSNARPIFSRAQTAARLTVSVVFPDVTLILNMCFVVWTCNKSDFTILCQILISAVVCQVVFVLVLH